METTFKLAEKSDNAAIRNMLSNNHVPGRIALTFKREPDYFIGCASLGHFFQVLSCKLPETGDVIGIACRAVRNVFVNGSTKEIGYLGELRVDTRYRGRWLLSKGFKFLKELHADKKVAGYITTITEENYKAYGVLVKNALKQFPKYKELDRLHAIALILNNKKPMKNNAWKANCANKKDVLLIVNFLNRYGKEKQFFPCLTEDSFNSFLPPLNLNIEDFIVVKEGQEILGAGALWDQSPYKQVVVHSYSGEPILPEPGGKVLLIYASFICVKENNPDIFNFLLSNLCYTARQKGYSYIALGFTSKDPLLKTAKKYSHVEYLSKIYTVAWEEEEYFHEQFDGRIPYIELATL